MTDQPTPRPMTANQLRAVVNQIARTYLEVERGLRSPDQLAAFLSRAEYHRHRVTSRGPRAASRPVRPTDIGKVRLDAATPDRVNASVRVRRDDGTWSALVVDLKQTGHGWQVERLDRLERLLPREPRNVEIDEDAVERRRRFVRDELRAVQRAFEVVAKRYEALGDKRSREGHRLRRERDGWLRIATELKQDNSGHEHPDPPRGRAGVSLGQGADAGVDISDVLGPQPLDEPGAVQWLRARDALIQYQAGSGETDILRAAGTPGEECARRELLKYLGAVAASRRDARPTDRNVSRSRAAEHPKIAVVGFPEV